ncbi:hypothetical protein [Burkholderia plantarii]|uniref:Uncharacterized protein n=1 Tax=Burkholderia plantarii TaxID=41899 RepID=A0A0B6RY14_BURPL|nr:hypothetical protein [Burkholderia plantarii]AJK47064.1 hypothetical protein BGL_1c25750 [Burkholderia plantarii]
MKTLPNVRTFAPEYWGEIGKFQQFHSTTHAFTPHAKKAVSAIKGHFEKALILLSVAKKLAPNMQIDNAQLDEKGFTPAVNSQEVAAVVEEVFTELYSSIDCASKVISFVYQRVRRMPDSTRKLFRLASTGGFGDDFPAALRDAFVAADWYDELRMLRDELTHANVGTCRLDQDGKIFYMHTGMRRDGNALLFPDVFAKLDELFNGVNLFLGRMFRFLNQGLVAAPVDEVCGVFFGRGYLRKLVIADEIDFNSGVCQSRSWFDNQPEFRCPFASTCGAYARAAEAHQPTSTLPASAERMA